ncbi:Protein of unknown function [Halobacillus aidingensis]|uniref:DUF3243 domain-containing protein n=2 Tax=Halobacillus TaxID=45667 RepID=A0A1H0FYT6_HALAD|nr:Protein of unknown function [Halobacillus aidingensis]
MRGPDAFQCLLNSEKGNGLYTRNKGGITLVHDPKQAAKQMNEEKKEDILQHFETFKDYLGDKVQKGEKLGLGEEGLSKGAKRVADYLAEHEEPRNREEKVLNELWNVANKEEREHMAHVLVKLTDQTN